MNLSWNDLVGPIPSYIISMENLISVDFSYNQLSGWVSSTRHFDHTGFLGNPGLYGLYLSPCQYDPPPPHHHHHHTCSSKVVLIVILLVPLITQHLEIKQLCTFINNKILFFFFCQISKLQSNPIGVILQQWMHILKDFHKGGHLNMVSRTCTKGKSQLKTKHTNKKWIWLQTLLSFTYSSTFNESPNKKGFFS